MYGSPTIISGNIEGTSSKGGVFYGLTGGVIGSWGTTSYALYEEGGSVGLLRTSLLGTLTPIDSSSGTASGSGMLSLQKSLGTVTLPAPNPDYPTPLGVFKNFVDTSTAYPASFSGPWAFGDAVTLDTTIDNSIDYKGIATNEGKRITIILEKALGTYTNAGPSGPYSLAAGMMGFQDGSGAYLLGPAIFTDNHANKMSMVVSYNYLDEYYMGTRDMQYYGTYDGVPTYDPIYGTPYRWMGTGAQVLTPLKFSSVFTTATANQVQLYRAVSGTDYDGSYMQQDGVNGPYYDYKYEYVETSKSASGSAYSLGKKNDEYGDSKGYASSKSHYFPDGTRIDESSGGGMEKYSSWNIGSSKIDTIGSISYVESLDGGFWNHTDSTFVPDHYSSFSIDVLEQRSADTFTGILGSTGYPWDTGGASITIMGKYTASDYTKPTIFLSQLSGNFYSTAVSVDGTTNGAYAGSMGGFLADDARGVQGRVYGVYIGPDNATAGVLTGSYTGSLYSGIGMWDATGTLSATVMNSAFASNPSGVTKDSLDTNLVYGAIGSEMKGHFTSGGSAVSGSMIGTMVSSGDTLSIKGQDWGVYNASIWVGGYGVPSTSLYTSWKGQVGGEGQFGEYQTDAGLQPDTGFCFVPINNGAFTGNMVTGSAALGNDYATAAGKFMTMTKMGTISTDILGIYTTPGTIASNTLYSWQGQIGGVWKKTQDLTFASSFKTDTLNFAEQHSGNYSSGSKNIYYYYDNSANYGEITINNGDGTTTKKIYETDSGPLNTKAWEVFTYDNDTKVVNPFSYSTGATDYPSFFDDTFFQGLGGTPTSSVSTDTWTSFYGSGSGSMSAIMGGTGNLWSATSTSPATVYFLGNYDWWPGKPYSIFGTDIVSYNVKDSVHPYTTLDGNGAYIGYIGGSEIDGTIGGSIYAIYLNKKDAGNSYAGILKGAFTGTAYQDIGMWGGTGSMYPVYLMDVSIAYTSLTGNVYTNSFDSDHMLSGSFKLNGIPIGGGYSEGQYAAFHPAEGTWGVFQGAYGGKYAESPGNNWSASSEFIDSTRIIGEEVTGTQWSSNKITGTTRGYGADINPITPVTWVSVGEVMGTFNPTLLTFQTVSMGVSIETNTLINLASTADGRAQLQKLNIPAVQVGMDTLTGSGNNFSALSMTGVKFFATSAGGKPTIWATNSVTGSYSAPPSTSTAISLAGSTLSASFTFQQWNTGNGKWLGSVSGTGGFNGSTSFKGAAAGLGAAAGSGSITTGTAAGTAK
jgi:hypothetical protein